MVKEVVTAAGLVVTVNIALVEFAAIITLSGTCAAASIAAR